MGRAVAENGPAALRTTAASFSAASSFARSSRSNARQGRPSGLATAFSLLGFRPASITLAPLARASRAMSLPVKPVAPYMRMCFVISQLSTRPFAWLEQSAYSRAKAPEWRRPRVDGERGSLFPRAGEGIRAARPGERSPRHRRRALVIARNRARPQPLGVATDDERLRHGRLTEPRVKRIERANAETLEISCVAGYDGQAVNVSGGRDHGVFDQMIRPTVHEARPGAERPRVHAQDVVGFGNLLEPRLDLRRPVLILIASDLDARLNLADRYGGEMQVLVSYAFEPSDNRPVRTSPAQLRHDICVEEVHYTRLCGARLRLPPRRGMLSSPRAKSVDSNSFSPGLAARSSRRQSFTGTRTAASAPRFVMTCGPSLRQVSSISLNRAFAS